MKAKLLTLVLMLGVLCAPATYAGPERDLAVASADPASKASLAAICNNVYKAVKAEPKQAVAIYNDVISQRTTWTSAQCAAIFRAVMMARPDLNADLSRLIGLHRGGKFGKNAAACPEGVPQEVYDMIRVLYDSSLEDGVPEETINELLIIPDDDNHDWGAPPTPIDIIVTPDDTSTTR